MTDWVLHMQKAKAIAASHDEEAGKNRSCILLMEISCDIRKKTSLPSGGTRQDMGLPELGGLKRKSKMWETPAQSEK